MIAGEIRTDWDESATARTYGGRVIRNIPTHGWWSALDLRRDGGRRKHPLRDTKVTDGSGSVPVGHSGVEHPRAIARLRP